MLRNVLDGHTTVSLPVRGLLATTRRTVRTVHTAVDKQILCSQRTFTHRREKQATRVGQWDKQHYV